MTPTVLAGLTGMLQGARHALEPDHVTAVTTVMVEAPSLRRGIFYATCWGLGHATMLLAVGGPLVALRIDLPGPVTTVLEIGVGLMLIFLGVKTLIDARREVKQSWTKRDAPASVRARRPLAIGLMHGLAGSGALATLIALGTPTVLAGLMCIGLYAVGTVAGMVALAALAGPMLARAGKTPAVAGSIVQLAGIASIGVGIAWTVRTLSAW
jgi:high-affinity nickel-transport protein